ncbi:MAG TPA: disulfide isomerase DsbC N-terminal domain-containing protein, partial [Telluria sp.]|nr:disulfide isomerase DsbC N-terminal domain-containing protein [Telluria sp.]
MLKSKLALLMAALTVASCARAEPSVEDTIRRTIEPRLSNGAKIDSVRATPYAGLYEVRVGGEILYTDKKGEYIVMGQVFEAKSSRNLTRERLDEINKIKFSDLPLESAIKYVKGDG